ncbi:DUF559 domain-containing protein [Fulvivirga sp.]|uniref:endonuclease domain-containing protein n=1 Tax=Fulvivirga sp. TaxID=1931237 RepID=UPI0032ECC03C
MVNKPPVPVGGGDSFASQGAGGSLPPFKEEYPQGEVVHNHKYPQGQMVFNNLPHLKTFRKELRNNSTPAEATLWTLLSGKKLEGRKFRRQHSVANYILDFYCPSEKLAIELDGQGHFEAAQAEYDRERDLFINHLGIKVLRFENKEVFEHPEALLEQVKAEFGWYVNHPALQAPLLSEEGNVLVYKDVPGFSKSATLEEVQKQDYKLTPGIYVGTEEAAADDEPFEEKMERLKSQLIEQFEEGDRLKNDIKINLANI